MLLAELDGLAEQVIRLPERTAVERALARRLPADAQRAALSAVNDLYGLGLDVDDITDPDLEESIVKQLKQKNGLHQPFVAALPDGIVPPWPPRCWTPSPSRPGRRHSRICRTRELPADSRPAAGHRRGQTSNPTPG
jgi:hypothetical protein